MLGSTINTCKYSKFVLDHLVNQSSSDFFWGGGFVIINKYAYFYVSFMISSFKKEIPYRKLC